MAEPPESSTALHGRPPSAEYTAEAVGDLLGPDYDRVRRLRLHAYQDQSGAEENRQNRHHIHGDRAEDLITRGDAQDEFKGRERQGGSGGEGDGRRALL